MDGFSFPRKLYAYRHVLAAMAVHELRSRYTGTLAGFLWSFLNPFITILVYWFVFSVGLKVKPVGDVPFAVVFSVGFLPWMTFSEILAANTGAVTNNRHLVTKMVFPTELLPFVSLFSSLIVHGAMLAVLWLVLAVNGIPSSIFNLQFVYYLLAMAVFAAGLSFICSAVNVFYRDAGMVLGVVTNIWFWLTPIVWSIDVLPVGLRPLLRLNPMFYIIEGYRDSFYRGVPFWNDYAAGLYFWAVTLALLCLGGVVFKRLKPEFADVL